MSKGEKSAGQSPDQSDVDDFETEAKRLKQELQTLRKKMRNQQRVDAKTLEKSFGI